MSTLQSPKHKHNFWLPKEGHPPLTKAADMTFPPLCPFESIFQQWGQPRDQAQMGASSSARECSQPKCTPNAAEKLLVWSTSTHLPCTKGSVRGHALPLLDTAPGLPGLPKDEQLLREDPSQVIQVQDLLSAPVGFAFLPHRCFSSFYFVAVMSLYPILFCGFFPF